MNATLLCVALLVPGYGEKDFTKWIYDEGGEIGRILDGRGGGYCVRMPEATMNADLCELCGLRECRWLVLTNAKISDSGLRTVSQLKGINELYLAETLITDKGLRHLESMSNLRLLYLARCPNITNEGLARLQKALPECRIER